MQVENRSEYIDEFFKQFENSRYRTWIRWAEYQLNKHDLSIVKTMDEKEGKVLFSVIGVPTAEDPQIRRTLTKVTVNENQTQWNSENSYEAASEQEKAAAMAFAFAHMTATRFLLHNGLKPESFLQTIQNEYLKEYIQRTKSSSL